MSLNCRRMMRSGRVLNFLTVCFLAAAAAVLPGTRIQAGTQQQQTQQEQIQWNPVQQVTVQADSATVWTADASGAVFFGYRSEKDQTMYLFLPSGLSADALQVRITGGAAASTEGTLDAASGILTGAFRASGDSTLITFADASVLKLTVMQSSLPSVQIVMADSGDFAKIRQDKNSKSTGNAMRMTDSSGKEILLVSGVEMKGRGNSSYVFYDKKSYQVRLTEKTSLLGMPAARKWVLLSSNSDDSLLRSRIAENLSDSLGLRFTASFAPVDLWVDGEYLGSYLLGEKPEIGAGRLDLKDPLGVLMEQDFAFYYEEDNWFHDDAAGIFFAVKDAKASEPEQQKYAMNCFHQKLDTFLQYLESTPASNITLASLSQYIDVDSFADYYLITEYLLNREANGTSFYWYTDGQDDVLHLGPVWDFDTSMGNDGCGYDQYYGSENNAVISRLLQIPAFRKRTEQIYRQNKASFRSLTSVCDRYAREISASAAMNYARWDVLGKADPKGNRFASTWTQSVKDLRTWLAGRAKTFVPGGN